MPPTILAEEDVSASFCNEPAGKWAQMRTHACANAHVHTHAHKHIHNKHISMYFWLGCASHSVQQNWTHVQSAKKSCAHREHMRTSYLNEHILCILRLAG